MKSLNPTVNIVRFSSTQAVASLVTLATCGAILISFGHTAAHNIVRDKKILTIARTPVVIRVIRLNFICFCVRGIKEVWRLAAALVLRSINMAKKTTAKPATKPWPTFRIIKASITGLPSPGAPMRAAITTNETAAITV
ncbi:unannotated protein [freshwater metagenome]|uniref:Unannotated protein n=1 Tax=freshwater metagenome TaxID=449393 RepID=A0A6J6R721_9ZZZZ